MEDRFRRNSLCVDEIPEYEEDSWDDTGELVKDALCEAMGVKKCQIKRDYRIVAKKGSKDRTIVEKFNSYKGKQRIFNETRRQKREDIYVYEHFSKVTVAIRVENSEKV